MLPESVLALAENAYKSRVHDEWLQFARECRSLQEQFAFNNVCGGAAPTFFTELGRKALVNRAVIAAQEIQRACESTGAENFSRTFEADLHTAWASLVSQPTILTFDETILHLVEPHVPMPEVAQNLWREASAIGTTQGKRQADDILDHYAAQQKRDRSHAWKERKIAAVSAASGSALTYGVQHVADIVRGIGWLVHH